MKSMPLPIPAAKVGPRSNDRVWTLTGLAGDLISVWSLPLGLEDPALARCRQVLAREEQARALRFLSERQQKAYIACWGQLRWLLACRYLGQSPDLLQFDRGPWGKPRLAGSKENQGWVFNLSHSGGRMLVAVGRDRPLGIDIEALRLMSSMERLAERCFASQELEEWKALAEPLKLSAFFRFWTLKEAFVKADGRGLGLGVKHCVFSLTQGRPRILQVPESCGGAEQWWVREIEIVNDYVASLCSQGDFRLEIEELPPDWILRA